MIQKGQLNGNGNFDWKDAVVDAGISAAVATFTFLGTLGVVGIRTDPISTVLGASIMFGSTFFATIALKRGIIAKKDAE